MNTLSNRWNRPAARLLSTGLFVALAGAAMLTAEAAPMDGGGHRHGGGMMGGPMMGGMHGGRMLDAVGATAEQKAQIKQIMDAAHTELKAQRDAGRGCTTRCASCSPSPPSMRVPSKPCASRCWPSTTRPASA
jgi:protein CpxP